MFDLVVRFSRKYFRLFENKTNIKHNDKQEYEQHRWQSTPEELQSYNTQRFVEARDVAVSIAGGVALV